MLTMRMSHVLPKRVTIHARQLPTVLVKFAAPLPNVPGNVYVTLKMDLSSCLMSMQPVYTKTAVKNYWQNVRHLRHSTHVTAINVSKAAIPLLTNLTKSVPQMTRTANLAVDVTRKVAQYTTLYFSQDL